MQLNELQANHRNFILALAAEHGLSDVRVFGSVARGEAGPKSDLDLLVKIAPKVTLFKLSHFCNEVEDRIGMPVQVVGDDGIHPMIKDGILHDAVPL